LLSDISVDSHHHLSTVPGSPGEGGGGGEGDLELGGNDHDVDEDIDFGTLAGTRGESIYLL